MGAPVQNQQPANPAAPNQPGVAHRPTVVGFPETQQPQNQPAQKEAFQQRQPNPAPAGAQRPAPANHRGTVNVYTAAAPETEPKFSLNPVQKVNEPAAPAALEFKGQEAILNRDNTDPDNLSITSRQQASIAHRNGKWVITDLSDQQTTFVHPAKTGQELHEGDVILLGNRLFVFHEQ